MKFVIKCLSVAAFAFVVMILATQAWGMEPMPLPDFEVTSLDGVTLTSGELTLQGRWLLVYVRPHCLPCESLLNLLKKDYPANVPYKIVVLVGGPLEDVQTEVERFPDLTEVSWYADQSKDAFAQLKLQGFPVIMAVREDTIEWSIDGVLADTITLQSVLTTWLEQ